MHHEHPDLRAQLFDDGRAFVRSGNLLALAPHGWAMVVATGVAAGFWALPATWLVILTLAVHAAVPALAVGIAPREPWTPFLVGAAGLGAGYVVVCITVLGASCGTDHMCASTTPVVGPVLATLYVGYLCLAATATWAASGIVVLWSERHER